MMSSAATIEETVLEVSITDGRVAMNADVDETLYIQTPDLTPLGPDETAIALSVAGDGATARIELDHDDVRVLVDVLEAIDR
ncbi:hypothetical protein [Halovivax cerinus]|uniref:Uncharacterized protein n=1 Tax=Halovivax cerinus TaxID=1487865 RepID=A0ABD5NKR0_9EURY|nr:hypothetical protein [Halovivax cerinus]